MRSEKQPGRGSIDHDDPTRPKNLRRGSESAELRQRWSRTIADFEIMAQPRTIRFPRSAALLAGVGLTVAAVWTIQPDSMQAEGPRLQEVRSAPSIQPSLGTLSGSDGTSIVILPGDPDPSFRLLDDAGRDIITVQDWSTLETDHGVPELGGLLADVPTWTDPD